MNNNEQVFYIQYRQDDGYLTGMINQDQYNRLSDEDKKGYTQAIVDLKHLSGWGRYWDHCRYLNHALSYPDNYPKDQSETIADLKGQLKKIIASNNGSQKVADDLQTKLDEANSKITNNDAAAQKTINDLKQKLADANAQIADSNKKIESTNKQIKQVGAVAAGLQAQLAKAGVTNSENKEGSNQ